LPEQVQAFCGTACHAYPPADIFPQSVWRTEVERGYRFFEKSGLALRPPPIEHVIRYYEKRAPKELPPAKYTTAAHPLPVRFERVGWAGPNATAPRAISNVNLVHLSDPKKLDILACDMRNGHILALSPWQEKPSWRILATLEHPAHAEVLDLDGDGILDILVADLGSFLPTERRCGKVVSLRGPKAGSFKPHTLLHNVARGADTQPAHILHNHQ